MSLDSASPKPERPSAAKVDPAMPKNLGRIVATNADARKVALRKALILPNAARQYLQFFVWEFHTSNTTSLSDGGMVVSPRNGMWPFANLPIHVRKSMTPLSADVGRTFAAYESLAPGAEVRYLPVWARARSCP